MDKPLRVLIVEDSESDTLLLVRQLRRGGYDPVFQRVETRAAMSQALREDPWDVILSDFSLPRFSGNDALKLLKEHKLDIPFIVVSGAVGEDIAVSMMKAGACDFLLKEHLNRLAPAVMREVNAALARRRHLEAEAERTREKRHATERERLALVGELAAGVAHEFRNPLHGILNYLKILRANASLDASALEDITMIEEGLLRMEEISHRMLRLTRDDAGPKVPTALTTIIDDAMRFVRSRAEEAAVVLRHAIGVGAPETLVVDGERISEALLNLLKNAIDASPRDGVVEVRVPPVRNGCDKVEFWVTDQGPGVPEEMRERIFDAFFTTKAIGRGSGLGLSLARRIAENHGGSVEFEGAVKGLSTFVMRLNIRP